MSCFLVVINLLLVNENITIQFLQFCLNKVHCMSDIQLNNTKDAAVITVEVSGPFVAEDGGKCYLAVLLVDQCQQNTSYAMLSSGIP